MTTPPALPHAPGRPGPIWVDAEDFARARLLGGDPIPLDDLGEFGSYAARSVALSGTDAFLLDLGQAWGLALADGQMR